MRHVFALVVVSLLLAVAVFGGSVVVDRNSVGDVPFDPEKSAALFVGVREFSHDTTVAQVPYAVDDAVDLAYALSMDSASQLVTPPHVLLALSGEPQKPESQERLAALLKAGARKVSADTTDILVALETQAAETQEGGVFVATFATHGVTENGAQYLLGASSLLRYRDTTSLREAQIREIAASAHAGRSLIFIDACREKLVSGRNGEPDPHSRAAMIRQMENIRGQFVLSAAAYGEYAYDDDRRKNGVFTAAVIEGLHCATKRTAKGIVTAEALSDYVNARVLAWIQKHREPTARKATQFSADGMAKLMPVAVCTNHQ